MRFLNDEDVQHFIKIAVLGILGFLLVAVFLIFFFRTDYELQVSKYEFEVGETVKVSDLIKSIGDQPVSNENRISSNTIKMDDYEVTFTEIDTSKIGEQTITAKFTDTNIENQKFTVTIKDTEKPKIKWLVEEDSTISLEDAKKKNFDSLYEVSDNYTASSKIKIKSYIDEDNFDYGDSITLHIEATDSNKNTAKKEIKLKIEEKPEEETKEEESSSQENTQTDTQQNTQTNTQQQQQSTYQQQQPTVSKPANRYFSFDDGYDMSNVSQACQAALVASGYSGSCIPVTDSDGIYTGMQLIFN